VRREEFDRFTKKAVVVPTGRAQPGFAAGPCRNFQCAGENGFQVLAGGGHGGVFSTSAKNFDPFNDNSPQ
jgi:hypothetical protein